MFVVVLSFFTTPLVAASPETGVTANKAVNKVMVQTVVEYFIFGVYSALLLWLMIDRQEIKIRSD
jgi:hypothetical protein